MDGPAAVVELPVPVHVALALAVLELESKQIDVLPFGVNAVVGSRESTCARCTVSASGHFARRDFVNSTCSHTWYGKDHS